VTIYVLPGRAGFYGAEGEPEPYSQARYQNTGRFDANGRARAAEFLRGRKA